MPSKREVLAQLTREELQSAIATFQLTPAGRGREPLLEAVASSKKATLAAVFHEYSRDRLKDLCRGLGLDDAGRDKATLVERLAAPGKGGAKGAVDSNARPLPSEGNTYDAVPESSPLEARDSGAPGGSRRGRPPASKRDGAGPRAVAVPTEILPGEKLTLPKLEAHLWSAADILRGSIDSSDYKSFIFGLLFLKRLSDRFDEECDALRSVAGADLEDPDEHDFFVPRRARWGEIQKAATSVGETLNKAASALEEANAKSLEGVLAGIDFNDERKLGDNKSRDNILARLVQHFSKLNLRNANLSEPDMLGRAYEYLIAKFADDAGKKGGEFYTPRGVVKLIVEILAPQEGMRICDPTVGSAGMLVECAHYLQRHGKNPKNLSLNGQEKNLGTWAIAKMNLLLHGMLDQRIEKGDTIRDPKLRTEDGLMLFDRVIANPPFSLDEWGRDVAENDPYGRFEFGIPPKTKGDLAFLQHMIAVTNDKGTVGVVMPHGVLFRGAAEGEIRKGILQKDLVEAVIGLPTNLFYGTGIPAAVLILNRAKKPARRQKVLFIEASREFKEGTAQNSLRDEDVAKIARAVEAFETVDKYARVVDLAEIEKNDWNLNISRYVETAAAVEKVDVASALAKLRELEKARAEAEARMNGFLKELGYDT